MDENLQSSDLLEYVRTLQQAAEAIFQESTMDLVNHPPHYTSGKIEVIDFIEDQNLTYHLGNVVKYVARAGKKHPTLSGELEDLKKARWYLQRYIDALEADSKERAGAKPA
jgi:hypothetical protein